MIYEIQQRIKTLSRNTVGILDGNQPASFSLLNIKFSHWDFTWRDGEKQNHWLASSNVEASTVDEAYSEFSAKLARIVPKIALISQCYVQHLAQSFLIHRTDSPVAFVRYRVEINGVGLMFREQHLTALNLLLDQSEVPEEFYYYWNDAVNVVGYSPKLLLMFSAIEALVKIRAGKDKGAKDWEKLECILGSELKTDLFGVKGNSASGLRHRLVHGEYFNHDDSGKDYFDLVHKRIISYFNDVVLKEKLISQDIVRPQRHFQGNTEEGVFYIRSKGGQPLNLKDFLSDVNKTELYNLTDYEFVYDDVLTANY